MIIWKWIKGYRKKYKISSKGGVTQTERYKQFLQKNSE